MKEERRRRRRRKKTILGFGGVDGRLDIFSTEISSKYHPKYLSVLPLFMRSDRRGTKKIFSKQTDLSLSASKY
jgi:hypothetical protein